MKIVQKKYISVVILWQPQILKQNQETAAGPQSPFVQNDLFLIFRRQQVLKLTWRILNLTAVL